MALQVCSLEDGRIRELGRPYLIQRAHLQQPPSFIHEKDLKVLHLLLKGSRSWLDQHEGHVFPEDEHELLLAVLATLKCYVEIKPGSWKPLVLEGSYVAEPEWLVRGDGSQSLTWAHPKATRLWVLGDKPYGYDSERACLVQGVGDNVAKLACRVASQPSIGSKTLHDLDIDRPVDGLPAPGRVPVEALQAGLQPVLYFSAGDLKLGFRYSSEVLCVQRLMHEPSDTLSVWDGERLLCMAFQPESEQTHLGLLLPYLHGFTAGGEGLGWISEKKAAWIELLVNQRKPLEELGFQFIFEEGFKYYYTVPSDWSVELNSNKKEEWTLAVSFDVDGQRVNVLELLKQLRVFNQSSNTEYQEVQVDGKTLVLSSEMVGSLVAELGDLFEFDQSDGPIPFTQLYRLKKLKDHLPPSTQWLGATELLEQSIDLHSSPIMLDAGSSGVKAELRPYQWLGVCWMQHLKQSGFNGLLADDMGLGKTLQTLALLSLEKQNTQESCLGQAKPALIVAPTSLLSNWAGEIQRFCPHLKFIVLHGPQRHSLWDELQSQDVVITSYPLVVRDLQQWQQYELSWLVLDEAQVIKNANTKASKAVRELVSEHRLCLSGTPVENHLGELWSILDFLEPNILGSQKQFKSYYQKPIEVDVNQQRFSQLLSRIEPFILRRTKNQVAADLPPKTKVKKMVTLGEEQMAFYENLKTKDWESLSAKLDDSENSGQKQIMLLTALMRLRQVCCDPLLLPDGELDSPVPSAKTEFCLDMLKELVAEGRAVLVFSQFTSVLDILAERLAGLDIPHLTLTGKSRNRADIVDRFQKGLAPVFLISLKAGGVGLNLTRADTVIHFDPWWNQAAEEQASDRAHRIGQKNPVFVYKLIAENTIEEKIALMQERKALLSQQVNRQAQLSGESFALKLEDLIELLDTTGV